MDGHYASSIEGRITNNVVSRKRAFDFIICGSPSKLPWAEEYEIEKQRDNYDKHDDKKGWLHLNTF